MAGPVLVIGGGPAGSAAAIALARRGIDVLLFEQTAVLGNKLVETLYPDGDALLRALGMSQISRIPASVRYIGRDGETELTLSLNGNIGAIDRNELDDRLRTLAQSSGATLVRERVDGIQVRSDEVVISAQGESYRGSYLIDASGKNPVSVSGHRSDHPANVLDNRFNAFSHFVRPAGFEVDRRTIVALEGGFAYVLPIHADRICIGVTSYAAAGAKDIEETYARQLSSCRFLSALTSDARRVLPIIPAKNGEVSHPAVSDGRIIRVGDALGFRDPFLWDGLCFALETGRAAGEFCAGAIATGHANHSALSEFVTSLDLAIRRRTLDDHDGLAAQFNAAMLVDPHVSPILLGCLFSLTGKTGGLAGLRRELSAGPSLRSRRAHGPQRRRTGADVDRSARHVLSDQTSVHER